MARNEGDGRSGATRSAPYRARMASTWTVSPVSTVEHSSSLGGSHLLYTNRQSGGFDNREDRYEIRAPTILTLTGSRRSWRPRCDVDRIELGIGLDYLLANFLHVHGNRRSDIYGGSTLLER